VGLFRAGTGKTHARVDYTYTWGERHASTHVLRALCNSGARDRGDAGQGVPTCKSCQRRLGVVEPVAPMWADLTSRLEDVERAVPGDREAQHRLAEEVLLAWLRANGGGSAAYVWECMQGRWWYA
jgi:hypothetical protein